MAWTALLLAVVVAWSACGGYLFNSHGYSITLVNGTDVPVIAHESGGSGVFTRHIEPGATYESNWNVPSGPDDKRKHQVDATDAAGRPLFCERYTWDDIFRLKQRIVIIRDHLACD